jgi:hypothetical protein
MMVFSLVDGTFRLPRFIPTRPQHSGWFEWTSG